MSCARRHHLPTRSAGPNCGSGSNRSTALGTRGSTASPRYAFHPDQRRRLTSSARPTGGSGIWEPMNRSQKRREGSVTRDQRSLDVARGQRVPLPRSRLSSAGGSAHAPATHRRRLRARRLLGTLVGSSRWPPAHGDSAESTNARSCVPARMASSRPTPAPRICANSASRISSLRRRRRTCSSEAQLGVSSGRGGLG